MEDIVKRGSKGGAARAANLPQEKRKSIASEAAKARWARVRSEKELSSRNDILSISIPSTSDATQNIEIIPEPIPTPVVSNGFHPTQTKPTAKRKRPMVKPFGDAHSYAEKRLAQAIKERAEYMGKVAMLNAEIPSLVQIIKALGMTPNLNGFQDFTAQMPNMNPFQTPQAQISYPSVGVPPQAPPEIDPALFNANSTPLPGLAPGSQQIPLVPNMSAGGAIDLGYTPVDEDQGPGLPNIGGGWR